MSQEQTAGNQIIYGLDDKPPPGKAAVLALQHVLTMFGSTVAVPLLLGPAMGMTQSQIAVLISSVMLCSGLATWLQATYGSRLPIIQGVSFSFIVAFTTIISTLEKDGKTPAEMMQYIAGAIICGAVVEITIGFSGLMGIIRKALSPVVVGPVIMLIGLALYNVGAPYAGKHWPISILTMLLIVVFSLVLSRRSALFRMFPLLLAILIAVAVCGVLSLVGVFEGPTVDPQGARVAAHPAYVSLEAVEAAQWFRMSDVVLPWGPPKFRLGFIIAVFAGYLASMIESFGDYHACSHMAGGGDPTTAQISRGIGCEGIGCLATGLLGGFSSTSYSENIGLIGLTKVGSRYVVQIAGCLLILLGLFGKFGAVAAAIPLPVVGGLYCTLFGLISAVGVRQLARADLNADRNLFIAGFSLFMGLSVPYYFNSAAGAAALDSIKNNATTLVDMLASARYADLYGANFGKGVADVVGSIGKTGMAVAAILGITLDNLIPGTPQERGLAPRPSLLVPEADDIDQGVDDPTPHAH